MAHNSALSDGVTDTNNDLISPTVATSDNVTRKTTCIDYEKVLDLVSQELPDANSNLLKNPIHPIFRRQNWHFPAQEIWPQLQPALRLASRFVGEDEMLAFWYQLVWGRQEMKNESEAFGYALERFSTEGPPLNSTQRKQISRWLREYGEKQQSTFLNFEAGVELGNAMRTRAENIVVQLGWEILELLRDHGSGKKILSETKLLRVGFLIAIVLLHELGHAVYMSLSHSNYEPYYGNQAVAEIGHAWGCFAFGGPVSHEMTRTKKRPDWLGGLWVATPPIPWQTIPLPESWLASLPPPPVLGNLPKDATCWVLAPEYLQRVQTEEFWEKDIKAHGVRALHVPPIDGNHDSQLPLDTNWIASVSLRRVQDNDMVIPGCCLRTVHGEDILCPPQ